METATDLPASCCPNCGAVYTPGARFCSHCGQSAQVPRFSLVTIADEFSQAFTGIDRSVFQLVKCLAIAPGHTARAYILERKRKKYFNPFSFLLLVLGFYLTINTTVRPYTTPKNTVGRNSAVVVEQPANSTKPTRTADQILRQKKANEFVEQNTNLLGLVAIPVFSLGYWLFFLRRRINYAEHLVANSFFMGFATLVSILLTLVVTLLIPRYRSSLNELMLLFQLLYFSAAYYQFFRYKHTKGYLITLGASVVAFIPWIILSAGAITFYVYYG